MLNNEKDSGVARATIHLSRPAEIDFDSILLYLEQYNYKTALEWAEAFHARISQLESFPLMGQLVDSNYLRSSQDGLRFLSFDSYVLFHYVQNDEVLVSRILHKKRDLVGLLMTYEILP
jgi:plasmid stabilization system protein ParE